MTNGIYGTHVKEDNPQFRGPDSIEGTSSNCMRTYLLKQWQAKDTKWLVAYDCAV